MNSDQRLSYLHLMNKAAESEDRQSYFYYLKMAEQTLQRQDPDVIWKPAGESANHVGFDKNEPKAERR